MSIHEHGLISSPPVAGCPVAFDEHAIAHSACSLAALRIVGVLAINEEGVAVELRTPVTASPRVLAMWTDIVSSHGDAFFTLVARDIFVFAKVIACPMSLKARQRTTEVNERQNP